MAGLSFLLVHSPRDRREYVAIAPVTPLGDNLDEMDVGTLNASLHELIQSTHRGWHYC